MRVDIFYLIAFVCRGNHEIILSNQLFDIYIIQTASTHNFNIHSPSKMTVQFASATFKTVLSDEAMGEIISKANNKE